MSARGSLRIDLLPARQASSLLAGDDLLAALRFDGAAQQPVNGDAILQPIQPGLVQIGGEPLLEVWRIDEPLRHWREEGFALSASESILTGWTLLSADDAQLRDHSRIAYQRIGGLIRRHGYPRLQRMWNYLPRINQANADGLERYREFCIGRHEAMPAFAGDEVNLPAATGVGARYGGLLIYFIAGCAPVEQIENPRQVSAYHYPPAYGPRSPSFARATLTTDAAGSRLYISGTASIVGHETLHRDDVQAQLGVTLDNIELLLAEAERRTAELAALQLGDLDHLKVYLRHPAQRELIERGLRTRGAGRVPTLYLHGDICRAELLLEIEACYGFCDAAC